MILHRFTFRHTHYFNERNFAYALLQTHGSVATINERVVTARVPPPPHFTMDRTPSIAPPTTSTTAPTTTTTPSSPLLTTTPTPSEAAAIASGAV
jgi:hypothetical protein